MVDGRTSRSKRYMTSQVLRLDLYLSHLPLNYGGASHWITYPGRKQRVVTTGNDNGRKGLNLDQRHIRMVCEWFRSCRNANPLGKEIKVLIAGKGA